MKPVKGEVNWPKSVDPRAGKQPEKPAYRSSKDTKRWCKGKVGRRHQCAWETAYSSYRGGRPSGDYPDLLRLVCQYPGCNKIVLESWRLDRAWPTQWGSRHDRASAPAFYGPGLPGDFSWGWGRGEIPDYVDVIGAAR